MMPQLLYFLKLSAANMKHYCSRLVRYALDRNMCYHQCVDLGSLDPDRVSPVSEGPSGAEAKGR